MTNAAFDVVALGQCCVDYLVTTAAYPPADVKAECFDLTVQSGGPAATALAALARWGAACALCGVVGDDDYGPVVRAALDAEGVDTSALLVRPGAGTQFAFVVAEPAAARRTIFWRRATGAPPTAAEVPVDLVRRARVFHTDGLYVDGALAACDAARSAGVAVVLDLGTLRDHSLDLVRRSDHCLVSEPFAAALVGAPAVGPLDRSAAAEACRVLADLGPRVTAVTLGARGWVARDDGRPLEGAAHTVAVVDTTGCGDVFHGGYIKGLLEGWPTARSLEFGAWAAASVARFLGGWAGIPSLASWDRGDPAATAALAAPLSGSRSDRS